MKHHLITNKDDPPPTSPRLGEIPCGGTASGTDVDARSYARPPGRDVVDESYRLYKYHLRREAALGALAVPEYAVRGRRPAHGDALAGLADRFRASPQRAWVHDRAQTVDLGSLNFHTFRDLLDGLFQEGGVTYERVLVLFFFCTDLTIRAFREKMYEYFHRINQWIYSYLANRLSLWIEEQGGWGVVLSNSFTTLTKYAVLTLCCLGIIALTVYIKTKKSM